MGNIDWSQVLRTLLLFVAAGSALALLVAVLRVARRR